MAGPNDDGYYLEFHQAKGAIKVTAIDPATGIEVSIVGPPHTPQSQLSRLAVQKLEYRLKKEREKDITPVSASKKGIIV